MAKSVFYSFHYDRDAWRVQQIIQMGALEGQPILKAQEWEEVKRKGDAAIKKWIADQMAHKSAVVVLIGAQTASRPWVRHEIANAWDNHKPLVGIRIHGLERLHRLPRRRPVQQGHAERWRHSRRFRSGLQPQWLQQPGRLRDDQGQPYDLGRQCLQATLIALSARSSTGTIPTLARSIEMSMSSLSSRATRLPSDTHW